VRLCLLKRERERERERESKSHIHEFRGVLFGALT
jgi:hypothetical protein